MSGFMTTPFKLGRVDFERVSFTGADVKAALDPAKIEKIDPRTGLIWLLKVWGVTDQQVETYKLNDLDMELFKSKPEYYDQYYRCFYDYKGKEKPPARVVKESFLGHLDFNKRYGFEPIRNATHVDERTVFDTVYYNKSIVGVMRTSVGFCADAHDMASLAKMDSRCDFHSFREIDYLEHSPSAKGKSLSVLGLGETMIGWANEHAKHFGEKNLFFYDTDIRNLLDTKTWAMKLSFKKAGFMEMNFLRQNYFKPVLAMLPLLVLVSWGLKKEG